MSFESSLEKALKYLSRFGLEQHSQIIKEMALPAYLIKPLTTQEERPRKSQTGEIHSKNGGNPDLPKTFAWPVRNNQSLSFLMQINLEKLDTVPQNINNLNLPSSGLLSIFIYLEPDDDLRYVELINPPQIYIFDNLDQLENTEPPADLIKINNYIQKEFIKVGQEQIKNPFFGKTNQKPILKPDPDGSFTTYFKALENFVAGGNTSDHQEYIFKPILEERFREIEDKIDLSYGEQIFDFEVFASFPYWGEFDLFLKNGLPPELENNLDSWLRWWHQENNYSGTSILGYPQSVQGINREYIANTAKKTLKLKQNVDNLWHLLSIGTDFADYSNYGGLSESNNFYLYQNDNTSLELKQSWVDINCD